MNNIYKINNIFSLTFAILLSLIVLPSIVRIAFNTSSFSAGLMVNVIIVILYGLAFIDRGHRIYINNLKIKILVIILLLGLHGYVSYIFNNNFEVMRFQWSLIFSVLIFIGSIFFYKIANSWTDREAGAKLGLVYVILLATGYIGLTGFSPFSPDGAFLPGGGKPAFFFNEPSHYALAFLPFLLLMCITSNIRSRLICIISSVVLGLLYQSLTLLIGCALISVLTIPIHKFLFLLMVCGLIAFIFGVDADYYFQRVKLVDELSINLSNLVFFSGWERAVSSFYYSFGLGLGFQQFGIIEDQGEIMAIINMLTHDANINVLDGGSVAPKLIGEFGIFGIIMIICYLRLFIKTFTRIRAQIQTGKHYTANYYYLFSLCSVIMYSIDLFVRGTGYFSSTGFIFISSLIYISIYHSKHSYKKHLINQG